MASGAPLGADGQVVIAVEPSQAALDDPAMLLQSLAGGALSAGDANLTVATAPGVPAAGDVIGRASKKLVGTHAPSPVAPHRQGHGIEQNPKDDSIDRAGRRLMRRLMWHSSTVIRFTVIVALMLGSAVGSIATSAQEVVTDSTYTSPRFGYTISWDKDMWQLAGAYLPGSPVDLLELSIIGKGDAFILQGVDDYAGNPQTCLAALLAQYPEGEPREDLPRLEVEPDAAAALIQWGAVRYIECRALVPGKAVLIITFQGYNYEELFPEFDALMQTLDVPQAHDADAPATPVRFP